MQETRPSGATVAFAVLALLLRLVVAVGLQEVRRRLVWIGVAAVAAALIAVGLFASATPRGPTRVGS